MKSLESEQRRRARDINKQAAHETPRPFLDWWQTYGRERWMAGEVVVYPERRSKPFLTAADLAMLREMKVGL